MNSINAKSADIVIIGAGISGLWTLRTLKARGYDTVLLERDAIGSGQTIASQGIIHSGLKYALGGKISSVAKTISEMPQRWREVLKDDCLSAPSQNLLIPKGFVGNVVKLAAEKMLETRAQEHLPSEIKSAGFEGSVIRMDEPVLNIQKTLQALAEPHCTCIRKANRISFSNEAVNCDGNIIHAKAFIFTAAESNYAIARELGHDDNLETKARPLLMGMMKNAPFPLYAHLVGTSDKPVATITTHKTKDGTLVWYVGGAVAERKKEAAEYETYNAIKKAFSKYMPAVDLSNIGWATLQIDRIEGKSGPTMPDTPTIHQAENAIYAWPTKLTFAPLLADRVAQRLQNVEPSGINSDWSFLPQAGIAETPWDTTEWKKLN
jgi:hypothetical protein